MRFADGKQRPITAFAGRVRMREDYVRHTVGLVSSQRQAVLLMTSYLPWGSLPLGAALLSLALLLEARGRRPAAGGGADGVSGVSGAKGSRPHRCGARARGWWSPGRRAATPP
ncbi:hypothetical protein [Actinacidiphila glaucinigra]|uniref:hypothetical protein n=1 Tax=Actinacidiphila glaucinigra TaxID=235986 RepID=UPI0036E7F957